MVIGELNCQQQHHTEEKRRWEDKKKEGIVGCVCVLCVRGALSFVTYLTFSRTLTLSACNFRNNLSGYLTPDLFKVSHVLPKDSPPSP